MSTEIREPELDLSFLLDPIAPPSQGLAQVKATAKRRRFARLATGAAAALLLVAGVAALAAGPRNEGERRESLVAGPVELVRSASSAMKAAGSANVRLTLTGDPSDPDTIEEYAGAFSFTTAEGEVASPARGFAIRYLGEHIYLGGGDPEEEIWTVIDPEQARIAAEDPVRYDAAALLSLTSPGVAADLLSAAKAAEASGSQTIGGINGVRYRVTVDPDAQGLSDFARAAARWLDESAKTVEVVMASDGRMLGFSLNLGGGYGDLAMELDSFGAPVSVPVAPPASASVRAIDTVAPGSERQESQTRTGSVGGSID